MNHHSAYCSSARSLACRGAARTLALATAAVALCLPATAFAHHGFGLFDRTQDAILTAPPR